MTIKEARENAMRQLSRAIPARKGGDRPYYLCEKAIDAYANAKALAAHVDACMMRKRKDALGEVYIDISGGNCGDGWYCDGAKEIQELGR